MRPPVLRLLSATLLLAGCTGTQPRARTVPRAGTGSATARATAPAVGRPPGPASVLRDGTTGAPVGPERLVSLVAGADVIAFGELHGHPEGAKTELTLWRAISAAPDGRPGALALEFFEKDTQPDLDAHLAGTLPEADLVKRARQAPAYATTHGPLVAEAKSRGLAVLAANAPRRLVTAYRKQAEPYDAWKAALPEADRGLLPRATTEPDGPYRERFVGLMGEERGRTLFKAQALWDDAMSESVADFRAAHPTARVLLVVGGFHVEARLGTLAKLAARRPGDRVALVLMVVGDDPDLALPAAQKGQADLVLVVPAPPDEKQQP